MARIRIQLHKPWIPYLIFFVALLLTGISTYYVSKSAQERDRLRFINIVQQTQSNISARLEIYTALLRGTSGLFAEDAFVTNAEFEAYVERLLLQEHYLGVQGIGYITHGVSLGHDRKDKAIVTYLEPEEPITNKAMIGYDMRTDPSLRVALDLARDTGSVSASSKINDKLFMFIPLYFGGVVPTSLAERHALIQGYIYSPFRAEDLLHNIVITDTLQTVDFQIYDGSQSDKQHLLYNSLTKTNELSNEAPLFHATNKVSIGGRIWMIVFSTNSKFGIASQHQLPATIFLGGLLISLMFFLLSRSQYLARNHLEHTTAKLQASKEDLQKAIGMRDNFISAASHELKTPVTSMKVYAEVLLKQFQKSENTKAMQQLGKINKQIDKLMLLIHDLLDVTRLNSGHLSLHVEQFDMNILLTEIVEATQQIASKHTITIIGNVKKMIYGDREKIGQVVSNLLTNAIKYSPKADKIIVSVSNDNAIVTVSVEDFGIGIGKEHQKKIFRRFYRVNETNEKMFPGLGIGLFICNEIIKLHGGTISIISKQGKGSVFSFTLPVNSKKLIQKR